MNLFTLIPPQAPRLPILLSVPHAGTYFPAEVKNQFHTKFLDFPEDADWFVDQLYQFAPALGITMIVANYSRYVIDLNRDSTSKKLYHDARKETSLVPLKSFREETLYQQLPSSEEIERRRRLYYDPYYNKIEQILADLKNEFSEVLFFDAHSIKRQVESIQSDPFPDFILGNNDEKTASSPLIRKALETLSSSPFETCHNHPFKGGMLTRTFGKPEQGVHALQLEMSQDLYMDQEACLYDEKKAELVQKTLITLFQALKEEL